MTNTKLLVDFIVGHHNPISYEKLLTMMFFFDINYIKLTINTFTDVQYIKTATGVSPKQMLTVPNIKYSVKDRKYYFVGDNPDTLDIFETQLLYPIFNLVDKTALSELVNLYREDIIWCETPVGQVLDWNKYRELYKNSGPKILDPTLHNRIMKLKINTTTPTCDGMPLVNNIDVDKVIKEINEVDNYNEKLSTNLKALDAISKLEKNWNLYNADPIPQTLVDKARNMLYSLSHQPDHISPIAGGGIQFEFHKENEDYLEFEISEDNIKYYIEIPYIEKDEINSIIRNFYN